MTIKERAVWQNGYHWGSRHLYTLSCPGGIWLLCGRVYTVEVIWVKLILPYCPLCKWLCMAELTMHTFKESAFGWPPHREQRYHLVLTRPTKTSKRTLSMARSLCRNCSPKSRLSLHIPHSSGWHWRGKW